MRLISVLFLFYFFLLSSLKAHVSENSKVLSEAYCDLWNPEVQTKIDYNIEKTVKLMRLSH